MTCEAPGCNRTATTTVEDHSRSGVERRRVCLQHEPVDTGSRKAPTTCIAPECDRPIKAPSDPYARRLAPLRSLPRKANHLQEPPQFRRWTRSRAHPASTSRRSTTGSRCLAAQSEAPSLPPPWLAT